MSVVVFKEKLKMSTIIATLISFLGIILMVKPSLLVGNLLE